MNWEMKIENIDDIESVESVCHGIAFLFLLHFYNFYPVNFMSKILDLFWRNGRFELNRERYDDPRAGKSGWK